MGKKFVYLALIFLLCMISISAVNAVEDSSSDIISVDDNSEITLEENINECVAASAENEEPVSSDDGTFDALQTKISNAENGSTVTLENDYVYSSESQNNLIEITKSLTIDGKGHTIDGNGQVRIFNIENNAKVTLKNLNIINGYCVAVGAIFSMEVDLTIINTHFENNQAGGPNVSPSTYAGTIINSGGNLTIINSTIENSHATVKSQNGYLAQGGAIANIGNLTIINSNFTNNQVTGYYAHGGVINSLEGNLTIINSNFTNNQASGNEVMGGAIFISYGNLTIINSNFENNQAAGNFAGGGAVAADYGALTIINSSFTNNQASGSSAGYGGAIYRGYELTILNSTFENNRVTGNVEAFGGAIDTYTCNINMTNSTFKNNKGEANRVRGGAIYNGGGNLTATNSTFENNIINGGNIGSGGAIYASDCNLNITYSNFTSNRATGSSSKGNAISVEDNDEKSTIITNSIFVDNDVSAVYDNSTDTFFTGLVFEMDIPNFYAGSTITIRITETKTQNFNGTVKVRIGDENYTIEIRNGAGEQTTTPNLIPGAYTAILNFEGRGEYSPITCESEVFYIITEDTNTFTKLNEIINGNTNYTIYLNGDYRYYEGIEPDFINGITITRDMEIYANGITIDASKINRIFLIYNATVVLSGINFMNCANGFGAIYADCADLTIINSNFENNQIIGSSAYGGAIANYNGNLTIINSSFTNNQAIGGEAYGGAVATYGTSNLTVSNSNFTNNKVTGGLYGIGGAIFADGCSAIINSNFKNNIVTGDFAGGGAIFVSEANLNITNSNFTNNQANGNESGGIGGAVYAYAENNDLIIINSNFEYNKVTGGEYVEGGAVYGYANVNITNSTFKNNQAMGTEAVSSGAVFTGNSATIINSTFENNKAIGEFEAWGGAIYTISELRIINSTFENNQVESPLGSGGAIYDNSILFVTNSNFTNNKVTGGEYGTGGAIGVSDNSQLEVDNSVFESNKAMNFKGKGNAISAGQYSTVTISNSTFIDNDVDANYDNSTNKYISSVAFEIEYIDDFLIGSSITISVTETKNGNAFNGTVTVSIGDESYTLTFENGFGETAVTPSVVPGEYTVKLNFTGNEEYLPATCESDIFRIIGEDDGTFTKLNRVINGNDDPKIYLSDDFEFYVSVDSAFIDGIEINRDVEIYGNGITIDASNVNRIFSIYNANVVFHDINFINCADGGGAIYAYAGTLKIINCNFTNNTATVPYLSGGAIYNDNGDLTIINSNFKNNQATRYSAGGGAVYNHGILTIIDSTFENNKANGENEGYGGAIYSYDGTVTITNSSFTNNQATGKYGRGGAIYANKGTVTITNSGFINNQANGNYTYGGAVYNLDDATVTIDGTLFKSNHADYGEAISTQDGDNWINLSNSTFVDNNVAARFDDDTNKFLTEVAFEIGNINDFIRGSSITIHVTETEKGNAFNGIVTVSIGDESYTIEIVNGTGTRVVSPNVTPGAYVAKLSFAETGEYYSATAESNLFNVIGSPEIRIENIDNFVYGNSITVRVTALQSFSGELNLTIDGVNYSINVVNGSGERTITPSLSPGTYTASINFIGNGYYLAQKVESNPFNVTATTEIITKAVTAVYNKNAYLVITLKDNQGNLLKGTGIIVNFGTAEKYTTDENGQVKILVGNMIPKTYNVKIGYEGDSFYKESAAAVNVVVKKATPKLTAKSKTFKKAVKIKKYKITLKNNIGKVMKNIKVTLKVNKKTFTAKTNSKGQATFKIKKLSKKGTYKATITFKGNKYYNKVVKKVKIKIK